MRRIWLLAAVLTLCLLCAAQGEMRQPVDIEAEVCPGAVLENGVLTLPEGLTRMGWLPDDEDDAVSVYVSGYDLRDAQDRPLVHAVRLPSTLRELDWYSMTWLTLDEDLVIPEGVTSLTNVNTLMDVSAPRLVLPSTLTELELGGMNGYGYDGFPFGEIVISPENPAYCVVDGVVFTRDMTELVLYPNDLPAAHYDVPAGVQVIRDHAFMRNHQLQTVSLPIGLRSIGQYAFSNCGRLTAVNVPLTVTEIGFGTFLECVSLQRVTLPPPLAYLLTYDHAQEMYPEAVFEGCTALYGAFQGDNGDLVAQPGPTEEAWDDEPEDEPEGQG